MKFSEIRQLINTQSEVNRELAYQLILSSGAIEKYIEELYLIWRFSDAEKKKTIAKLIERYGYVDCLENLKALVDYEDEEDYTIHCACVLVNFSYLEYSFSDLIDIVSGKHPQFNDSPLDVMEDWDSFIWWFGSAQQKQSWIAIHGYNKQSAAPYEIFRKKQKSKIFALAKTRQPVNLEVALELIVNSWEIYDYIESLYLILRFSKKQEIQDKAESLIESNAYPYCLEDLDKLIGWKLETDSGKYTIWSPTQPTSLYLSKGFSYLIETLLRGEYRAYLSPQATIYRLPQDIPYSNWNAFVYWFGTEDQKDRWDASYT